MRHLLFHSIVVVLMALVTASNPGAQDLKALQEQYSAETDPALKVSILGQILENDSLADSSRAWALANRGRIQRDLGKLDAALADYRRARAVDETSYSAHFGYGAVCFDFEDWSEAEVGFSVALSIRPKDMPAGRALARSQLRQGNYFSSRKSYERLVEWFPLETDGHNGLSVVAVMEDSISLAWYHSNCALAIDPEDVDAKEFKARIASNFSEATLEEIECRSRTYADPEDFELWRAYGECCLKNRSVGAASIAYDRMMKLRPGDRSLPTKQAALLFMAGRPVAAAAALRTVAESTPNNILAGLLRYRALCDLRHGELALRLLREQLTRVEPDTAQGWYGQIADVILGRTAKEAVLAPGDAEKLELTYFTTIGYGFNSELWESAESLYGQSLVADLIVLNYDGEYPVQREFPQLWIDMVPDGSTVTLPAGQFLVEGTVLLLIERRDLTIKGTLNKRLAVNTGIFVDGGVATELTSNGASPVVRLYGCDNIRLENLVIDHLEGTQVHEFDASLSATQVTSLSVVNCTLRHSMRLADLERCKHVRFERCLLRDGDPYGLHLWEVEGVALIGNRTWAVSAPWAGAKVSGAFESEGNECMDRGVWDPWVSSLGIPVIRR